MDMERGIDAGYTCVDDRGFTDFGFEFDFDQVDECHRYLSLAFSLFYKFKFVEATNRNLMVDSSNGCLFFVEWKYELGQILILLLSRDPTLDKLSGKQRPGAKSHLKSGFQASSMHLYMPHPFTFELLLPPPVDCKSCTGIL